MPTAMTKLAAASACAAVAFVVYRRWSRQRAPASDSTVAVERLSPDKIAERLAGFENEIDVRAVAAAAATKSEDDAQVVAWTYPIAVNGACSRKMSWTPFDALGAAHSLAGPGTSESSTLARLRSLRAVCSQVASATGAQWVGVYQIVQPSAAVANHGAGGDPLALNLLKLAYVGAPSRPYFPLTAEFAEGSNNSTVAMTGTAVVYHDVLALPSDSPYYTCDDKVRAEACVPIFDAAGNEVLGIMDVEAFAPDVFRAPRMLGIVLAACKQLGEAGLFAN